MDIHKPIFGFMLEPKDDIMKPVKLSDDRSFYRNLKRTKRISRSLEEVLFELEDDEIALVGATFGSIKNPSLIVYRMSCMSTIEPYPASLLVYICIKRDGLYYYPPDILYDMLLAKETINFLQDYKEHQELVWTELPEIMRNVKNAFKGGVNSGRL